MDSMWCSTVVFVSSVLLMTFGFAPNGRRLPKSSAIRAVQARKYDVGVLHLEHPFDASGAQSYLKVLENDDIIIKALKEVQRSLFIYISANEKTEGSSSLSRYLSETYSRTWDEMVCDDHLDLKCTVLTEGLGDHTVSLRDLLVKNKPDIFYTPGTPGTELSGVSKCVETYGNTYAGSCLEDSVKYFFLDADNAALSSYSHVAIGGTFDRIHHGHKKLLALAAMHCRDCLTVGVSGDALLAKKKGVELIAPQAERMQNVRDFLGSAFPTLSLNVVPIDDPYGPTISDASIDAIIVSSETIVGAKKINVKRRERGFTPLDVLISRRGETAIMSSTFLRERG